MSKFDAYSDKVRKVAKGKNFLIKYRMIIIPALSLVMAATAGYVVSKGSVVGTLAVTPVVEYGEEVIFESDVTALFSKVSYEYKRLEDGEGNAVSEEWTSASPTDVGKYSVRAVGESTFGERYSKESQFTISARDITVFITSSSAVYGAELEYKVEKGNLTEVPSSYENKGLVNGDTITAMPYTIGDNGLKNNTTIHADTENMAITNNEGNVCTNLYNIHYVDTSINFSPKEITINTISDSKTYDKDAIVFNGEISNNTLTSLAYNDELAIDYSIKDSDNNVLDANPVNAGTYTVSVTNAKINGTDVSENENYKVKYTDSTLTINRRSVTIKANNMEDKIYDGTADYVYDGSYTVAEDSKYDFADGDSVTIDVSFDAVNAKDAGTYKVYFKEVTEYGDSSMENNYQFIASEEAASYNILKKDVTIRAKDKEDDKTYDGEYYSSFDSASDYEFADGEILEADTFTVSPRYESNGFDVENPTDAGDYDIYIASVDFTDKNNDKNYNITYSDEAASLKINKREVIIAPVDKEATYSALDYVYDSTSFTCEEGSFINGDEKYVNISVYYENSSNNTDTGYNAGEYKVYIENIEFVDLDNRMDTNYEVTASVNCSTLIVKPLEFTIATDKAADVTYNKEAYDDVYVTYKFTENSICDADEISDQSYEYYDENKVKLSSNPVNAGTYFVRITDAILSDDIKDNYIISYSENYVQFEIRQREVTIKIKDIEDGCVYNNEVKDVYQPESFEIVSVKEDYEDGYDPFIDEDYVELASYTYENEKGETSPKNAGTYTVSASVNYLVSTMEGNYNIIVNSGTLNIAKASVTLTADDASKVYDSAPLTCSSYTTEDTVYGTLSLTYEGSITNVGTEVNKISGYEFSDGNDNYDVTTVNGLLTVTKCPVTITANSATKAYDSTALTDDGYTTEGNIYGTLTVVIEGSVTNVDEGTVENKITSVTFSDGNDNYDITTVNGELVVTVLDVTVRTDSAANVTYTKEEYSGDDNVGYSESAGTLYTEEYALSYTYYDSSMNFIDYVPVNAGDYYVRVTGITFTNEVDTHNYNVTFDDVLASFTINKAKVKITAASDEKVYDSTALTNDGWSTDDVYYGELTVVVEGTITNVADSPATNAITDWTFSDGNDNYDVTPVSGKLTVTPCPVTIIVDSTKDTTYNKTAYNDSNLTYAFTSEKSIYPVDLYTVSYDYFDETYIPLGYNPVNAGAYYVRPVVHFTDPVDDANYDIDASQYASFVINKREVNIKINDRLTGYTYNGADQDVYSYNDFAVTSTSADYDDGFGPFIDDDYVKIDEFAYKNEKGETVPHNAGTYTIDSVSYSYTDSSMTGNYIINIASGTYVIEKAKVTITAASETEPYDSDPLTNDGWTVDGNVYGTLTVVVEGSVTDVDEGIVENKVASWTFSDGNDNYDVTTVSGTLQVTVIDVTIKTTGAEDDVYTDEEYDAEIYYTTTVGQIYPSDSYTLTYTYYDSDMNLIDYVPYDVGSYYVRVTGVEFKDAVDKNNYNISYDNGMDGSFSIGTLDITVNFEYSDSTKAVKEYDRENVNELVNSIITYKASFEKATDSVSLTYKYYYLDGENKVYVDVANVMDARTYHIEGVITNNDTTHYNVTNADLLAVYQVTDSETLVMTEYDYLEFTINPRTVNISASFGNNVKKIYYDGKDHSFDELGGTYVTSDLLDGDTLSIHARFKGTGSSDSESYYVHIDQEDSISEAATYTVTISENDFTINGILNNSNYKLVDSSNRSVTYTIDKLSVKVSNGTFGGTDYYIFNGQPKYIAEGNDYIDSSNLDDITKELLDEFGFVVGRDRYSTKFSVTEVGTYTNEQTVSIFDPDTGEEKSHNFTIELVKGTITIAKRDIYLKLDLSKTEYDYTGAAVSISAGAYKYYADEECTVSATKYSEVPADPNNVSDFTGISAIKNSTLTTMKDAGVYTDYDITKVDFNKVKQTIDEADSKIDYKDSKHSLESYNIVFVDKPTITIKQISLEFNFDGNEFSTAYTASDFDITNYFKLKTGSKILTSDGTLNIDTSKIIITNEDGDEVAYSDLKEVIGTYTITVPNSALYFDKKFTKPITDNANYLLVGDENHQATLEFTKYEFNSSTFYIWTSSSSKAYVSEDDELTDSNFYYAYKNSVGTMPDGFAGYTIVLDESKEQPKVTSADLNTAVSNKLVFKVLNAKGDDVTECFDLESCYYECGYLLITTEFLVSTPSNIYGESTYLNDGTLMYNLWAGSSSADIYYKAEVYRIENGNDDVVSKLSTAGNYTLYISSLALYTSDGSQLSSEVLSQYKISFDSGENYIDYIPEESDGIITMTLDETISYYIDTRYMELKPKDVTVSIYDGCDYIDENGYITVTSSEAVVLTTQPSKLIGTIYERRLYELADGDYFDSVISTVTLTNSKGYLYTSSSTNLIKSVVIRNAEGEDVTSSYELKYSYQYGIDHTSYGSRFYGKLKINTRDIEIIPDGNADDPFTYDGQRHAVNGFTMVEDRADCVTGNYTAANYGLLSGHTATVVNNGFVQINPGTKQNKVILKITDQYGNNVTNLYKVHYASSADTVLVINKKDITITSGSESFVYDSSAEYTNHTFEVSYVGLSDGVTYTESFEGTSGTMTIDGNTVTFKVTFTNMIDHKGSEENTFVVSIVGSNNGSVTKYYNVTSVYGTLSCS